MQYDIEKNPSYAERKSKSINSATTLDYHIFFFIGITNRPGIVMNITSENVGFFSDITCFVKHDKELELKNICKVDVNFRRIPVSCSIFVKALFQ